MAGGAEFCCHRYPIEQLADPSPDGAGDYLESCYLLLYGELPTPEQRKQFNWEIVHHTMVPEPLIQFYKVGTAVAQDLLLKQLSLRVPTKSVTCPLWFKVLYPQELSCCGNWQVNWVLVVCDRVSGMTLLQWP